MFILIPTPSDLPASLIEDLPVLIHQRIVSVGIGERSISYVWKGVYIAVTALH